MSMWLGFYNTSSTRTHVRFPFTTHAQTGGAVAPNSAFEAADIRIYRANDATAISDAQRSSSNGITMTSPFDTTGLHTVDIDLTDNSDAGFYASGYLYYVVLSPDETVDGQTVVQTLAHFEIGPNPVNVTHFGGTAGTFSSGRPEVNTSHWGGTAVGSTEVRANLINIAGVAVSTSTAQLGVNAVQAGGTAWGSGAITNASIANNAINDAKVDPDVTIASVTGSVGSVTGSVGGNVAGSVGSISGVTFPSNFGSLGINASGHVSRVTLADTVTTLTGHTVQTGDAYAIVNSGTHGNAALKTLIDTVDTVVDTIIVDTGTDIPASLTTIADYLDTEVAAILAAVDTEVAAIKAKTDNLPADPADASDIAASFTTVNTKLDTIDDLIDSEVGAISTNIDSLLAMTASGTTTGSPTTTSIQGTGAGLSSSNDVYNNQFLVACSGVLQGVAREITDYVGATKTFTTDEWPSALASGVTIRVVGKVEAAE